MNPLLIRISLLAATAVTVWFLVWQGFSRVLGVIVDFGWNFLWLAGIFLLSQIPFTLSWQRLFPAHAAPPFVRLYLASWLGTAVNTILPLASLSGEAARARVLMTAGSSATDTGASLLLSKTVEALSLVVAGGIASILALTGYGVTVVTLVCVAGWMLLALGVLLFIILQRRGLLGILAGRWQEYLPGNVSTITQGLVRMDETIRLAHYRSRRLLESLVYMLLYRAIMITEFYWLFVWADNLLDWQDALIIDSLGAALKGLAFVVPAGIGVQEASYMGLGAMAGAATAVMLALSLIRRARDILAGLPVLLFWQLREGHLLFDRSRIALPARPE